MRRYFYFLALICALLAGGCGKDKSNRDYNPPKPPTPSTNPTGDHSSVVFLIGDSTCAPKSEEERPKYGWGEKFAACLDSYTVENKAVGGKSTKTYISGGQWAKFLKTFKKGDIVLIQFGHNDESTSSSDDRGTTPEEYYTNLRKFISETKEKEAVPVILTPICRLSFTNGVPNHTHKTYPDKAKQAAADGGAVCLDIEQLTYEWLGRLGEEAATLRFMISVNGTDTTHLTETGASEIAGIVAQALKNCGDPYLSKFVI